MTFKIKKGDGDLTLSRSNTEIILMVSLIVIGFTFLLLGTLAYLGAPQERTPFIFIGFGLIFSIAPFAFISRRKLQPKLLLFDNQAGLLRLVNGANKGYIKYQDILRFETIRRKNSYVIILRKKDGSFFELNYFSNKEKAMAYLKTLYDKTELTQKNTTSEDITSPPQVVMHKGAEADSYTWRTSALKGALLFFPMILGFAATFYGFNLAGFKLYLAVGVLGLLTILLMVALINSITSKFRLTIGQEQVTFSVIRFGKEKPKRSIALSQIAAVFFNVSNQSADSNLFLVTFKEKQMLEEMAQLGKNDPEGTLEKLEFVGTALSKLFAYRNIMSVNIHDLSIFEKLHLETLVQNSLREKGGMQGL